MSAKQYTVTSLAKISGVSVRTLHWYDAIGLLPPAGCGDQGYRYYGEEQLLRLQQILFFRELGLSLRSIREILSRCDNDTVTILHSQRVALLDEIERKKRLITTIDATIARVTKGQIVDDKELFYGLESEKQKEYERYLVQRKGTQAQELIDESKQRMANWSTEDWKDMKTQSDDVHVLLAQAIDRGLSPESDEVQALVAQHYKMIQKFYTPTKEIYIGLAQMYTEHPDFKKFYDAYHPKMVEYLGAAMRYYAEKYL